MSESTTPCTHFATEQFDSWRETIAVVFDVECSAETAVPFEARVDAFHLGNMVVADAHLGDQRYVRSSARARRDGMDHFVFNLYRTGGWRARTGQAEFEGTAGQVSVLDLSCDLISDEPASDLVALFVPRTLIEDRVPNLSALHGRAPTGPQASLLAEYIDLLARRLPTLPAGNEYALSRATCEMLAACLQSSLVGLEAARPGMELVLLRRAKKFIDARLTSPTLHVDAICHAVGVSRRTLYRLFTQEGGVQHYIQSRRLERIRTQLTEPSETRRISEVAAEFGFQRSDHFARAFKHRFGQSPRDLREMGTEGFATQAVPSSSKAGETQSLDNWIRTLQT